MHFCVVMDQFAAQAFAAYNPRFLNTPFVVVKQNPESHKTSVSACSFVAVDMGVKPDTPVRVIRRDFPEVKMVQYDNRWEATAREDLTHIMEEYTPEFYVQDSGVCLMDFSGTWASKNPKCIVEELGDEIRYKIRITDVAFGISLNKLLAKLLATLACPSGVEICNPGEEEDTLEALDVEVLPGISDGVRERIKKYGIQTVKQVRNLGRQSLACRLGKEGEVLYSLSRGVDLVPQVEGKRREVRVESVLNRDINDFSRLKQYAKLISDKLSHQLKSRGMKTKRVTVVLKYSDDRTTRKTVKLGSPTNEFPVLMPVVVETFEQLYQRRIAIKSIRAVVRSPLVDDGQLNLFESNTASKFRQRTYAISHIREKMGFDSVLNASYLNILSDAKTDEDMEAHHTTT
ncbi:MAG: hypothetical protein CME25_13735 [Gemmatimonadetes bacterium]|nr:hypothetical protein [Gemmatimonadota bacterium]